MSSHFSSDEARDRESLAEALSSLDSTAGNIVLPPNISAEQVSMVLAALRSDNPSLSTQASEAPTVSLPPVQSEVTVENTAATVVIKQEPVETAENSEVGAAVDPVRAVPQAKLVAHDHGYPLGSELPRGPPNSPSKPLASLAQPSPATVSRNAAQSIAQVTHTLLNWCIRVSV